jgi:hypothetical protein
MLASPARALSRALLAAAARPAPIGRASTHNTRAMATTATAGGLPVEVRRG